MKHFSLFSVAVISTLLAVDGFAETNGNVELEQRTEVQLVQQSESLQTQDFVAAYGDRNGASNGAQMRRPGPPPQSPEGPPVPPNRDLMIDSVHGCMDSGFSIQGEFLWWRAILDNLEYALKNNAVITDPANFPQGQTFNFSVREPDFEFDAGFRVAAGYDFGRDNWDVFLRWTYHYTNPKDSIDAGTGNNILLVTRVEPISISQNLGEVALSSNGKVDWDLHFNALDFEMGYDYFFSHRFSIRPHMGLKVAWLDMDYKVSYPNAFAVTGSVDEDLSAKGDSDYWGIGPRFGIDGYLHMGWGFSLYGFLSGALLYGEYDAKYNQAVLEVPQGPGQIGVRFNIKQDSFYRLRTTVQMALGLEWAYCFSRNYLLALHIGWETQYWWNQLEMPFFGYFQPEGDLTFSGLNVGARFDF